MTDGGVAVARAGLTAAEAAHRLATDGPNELPTARARGLLAQVAAVLAEPMILLLVAAGTVNLILAETLDAILLTASVLVIVGISIVQERRTETALAALRDLSAPRALVVRDGERVRIAGRDVVRGDLVVLVEGDRVPADAVVIESSALSVDESLLTGESVPVRKVAADPTAAIGAPGGDATPWVFSGTLVVRGRGLAVVAATGATTELGRIGTALGEIAEERTPLQREVARIVRVIAVLGVGAAAAVVVIYGATRGNWLEGALAGIATAMAMLPEEFPVVLTVFLALGAWRMSRSGVLARRSAVIETLGSVTVLCVDKTGTLTMNAMVVGELIADGRTLVLDGTDVPEDFRDLIESAVLASPPMPFDPMDRAFRDLGNRHLGDAHDGWDLVREYPLSEDLLAVSHAWRPRRSVACAGSTRRAPPSSRVRSRPRRRRANASSPSPARASTARSRTTSATSPSSTSASPGSTTPCVPGCPSPSRSAPARGSAR
ncbi:MAG: HAD-IC family P-type ATPase [Actinomycetota bacterium]